MKHISVLLEEFLNFFDSVKIKSFFDGTLGAGGHAKALLERHSEIELFIGCDKDTAALEIAKDVLQPWQEKVRLFQGSFVNIGQFLQKAKIECVDGILLDLGLSSMQLEGERGFSFRVDAPLDMRMDRTAFPSAKEVVNTFSENKLGEIFRDLGEERRWRIAAKAIVEARRKKRIETTGELVEILAPVLGRVRGGKIHSATLVFQALRIFVNHEMEELPIVLKTGSEKLCSGGRMAVIAFHSLEDRIVKNTFRDLAKSELFSLLIKKPQVASRSECIKNPRARSAKMRVIERE